MNLFKQILPWINDDENRKIEVVPPPKWISGYAPVKGRLKAIKRNRSHGLMLIDFFATVVIHFCCKLTPISMTLHCEVAVEKSIETYRTSCIRRNLPPVLWISYCESEHLCLDNWDKLTEHCHREAQPLIALGDSVRGLFRLRPTKREFCRLCTPEECTAEGRK